MKKGDLFLFVSYAPGVGKTYQMQRIAREREAGGVKTIWVHLYQGLRASDPEAPAEFSLRDILSREPDAVILDELAMPGRDIDDRSRRICDDADELLSRGIDVYSTVNMLHIASVDRLCRESTGFGVASPLPDTWLDRAKQIYFIDRDIEYLSDDYRRGIIYPGKERNERIENLFKAENLALYRDTAIKLLEKYPQVIWIRRGN